MSDAEQHDGNGNTGQPPWQKRHSQITLVATVLIAVATIVNVVVSLYQWDASRKSAQAAQTAADAAKAAADTAQGQLAQMALQTPELVKAANAAQSAANTAEKALIDVEKPFLIVSIDSDEIARDISSPGDPSYASNVQISVENKGKQIAIINKIGVRLWFGKPYDQNMKPEEISQLQKPSLGWEQLNLCVGPDDTIPNPIVYPGKDAFPFSCTTKMSAHDFRALENNDGRVFMQWYLNYSDPLGISRESGATWIYGDAGKAGKGGPGKGFQRWKDANYNYDGRTIAAK